jgi:hypothetical protein
MNASYPIIGNNALVPSSQRDGMGKFFKPPPKSTPKGSPTSAIAAVA